MERLRVGEVILAYDVRGDGPPLVLLHGLGERAASWDNVRHSLAARFTTYAVDLRGHGDSDWPGEYGHALIEADVCGLLDALALRGVVLVGHSMGGSIGFRIAAHRPDLVGRLVVEDVIPPWPRRRRIPSRPAQELDYDWAAVPALMQEASTHDDVAWDELAQIAAPTLLVSGGAGSHLPVEKVSEVVERIPACTLVEINAGHHIHRRKPARFLEAVLDWLTATG